jgi:hypothetical protein
MMSSREESGNGRDDVGQDPPFVVTDGEVRAFHQKPSDACGTHSAIHPTQPFDLSDNFFCHVWGIQFWAMAAMICSPFAIRLWLKQVSDVSDWRGNP